MRGSSQQNTLSNSEAFYGRSKNHCSIETKEDYYITFLSYNSLTKAKSPVWPAAELPRFSYVKLTSDLTNPIISEQ